MGAAGLSSDQTEHILETIKKWVKSTGKKEIASIAIRNKLLEILPEVDQESADLFAWYQKTKD